MQAGVTPGGRTVTVKNRQIADVQITAEQLLRESAAYREEEVEVPEQKIVDEEELAEFQLRERKYYEGELRKYRTSMGVWLKYAKFEEKQLEWERARSVYERALDVDYKLPVLWKKYVEFELRGKNVNRARNIFERMVTTFPMQEEFWYKYIYMEEMLANFAAARGIFRRWMQWGPSKKAWEAFLRFELRHKEIEQARDIHKQYVACHPDVDTFLAWARFEEDTAPAAAGSAQFARVVYEQALDLLGKDAHKEELLVAFARFEARQQEYNRARTIYRFALDTLPTQHRRRLIQEFISFEKQHGSQERIEAVIFQRRRLLYEDEIKEDGTNYDSHFDAVRLEEMETKELKKKAVEAHRRQDVNRAAFGEAVKKATARTRAAYERAVENVPPVEEKRYWRRYVYLWINYAVWEELEMGNLAAARAVYARCLRAIPHKNFSFSKLWKLAAELEIRDRSIDNARKLLGRALGMAAKPRLYEFYLALERKLGEIDRCRTLYKSYVQRYPGLAQAWLGWAQLEQSLQEGQRARAIFNVAVEQEQLDMPELLWKAFIDFEIARKDLGAARALYDRLLERSGHLKVWLSAAQFQCTVVKNSAAARALYERAYLALKTAPERADRALLIDAWIDFEERFGSTDQLAHARSLKPSRIVKTRRITLDDGSLGPLEEYYEYTFADEQQSSSKKLSLLERARQWKQQKEQQQQQQQQD